MSDEFDRLGRGFSKLLKILPLMGLSSSKIQDSHISTIIMIILLLVFVFYNPVLCIILVVVASLSLGGQP
jgi:hypothetical protein